MTKKACSKGSSVAAAFSSIDLERELHRKEKALAEAAALLVLAKKYRALPQQDEDI